MSLDAVLTRILTAAYGNPLLERLLLSSMELIVVTAVVVAIIHLARLRSSRVVAMLWLVALSKPILGLVLGAPAPVFNVGSLGDLRVPNSVVSADASAQPSLHRTGPTDAQSAFFTIRQGPSATASVFTVSPAEVAPSVILRTTASDPASAGVLAPATRLSATKTPWPANPTQLIIGLWLAGVALVGLFSIADRLRIRRIAAASRPPSREIEALYAEAAVGRGPNSPRGRAQRLPRLLITNRLESPAIVGTFFPVIFLPAWMTVKPNPERIVWSLRHELTHWRHRDTAAGIVREVARMLFFFHPLVWWIGNRWKEASEVACDQVMVGTRRDARRYAEQLYQILAQVHTRRRIMLSSGLFATRTQIGKRIELLLKPRPRAASGRKLPAAMFLLVFSALVFSLGAEITPQADVHVKTGKDEDKGTHITIHEDGGRVIALTIRGDIEFSDDERNIESMSSDGKFEISEVRDGVERELKVVPEKNGELKWIFKVDGKTQSFDDKAREWFENLMDDVGIDGDDTHVVVRSQRVKGRKPLLLKPKPHVAIRVDEDGKKLARVFSIAEDDDGVTTILESDDGDDTDDIWITTRDDGNMLVRRGSNVRFGLSPEGRLTVTVKKNDDEHVLEVIPGKDDSRDYIYRLNGEQRPYGDDEKEIFRKYLRRLERGYELHVGERI